MNIIIPLAGKDSQFEEKGLFKPLVDINSKPLIKWCTESLEFLFKAENKVIFIILEEHENKYNVKDRLKKLYGDSIIIKIIPKLTEGAASTVLSCKEIIDNEEELIIYLADIYFDSDLENEIKNARNSDIDGLIPCFQSTKKKYSYVIKGKDNLISEVKEKQVISTNASSGFYYFKKGKDFIFAAQSMIKKNLRVNNLFYICPVYQELIDNGKNIKFVDSKFRFGLGSLEEIERFRNTINLNLRDSLVIFAHRGIFDNYPENSLKAIKEALSQDFSLEIDVRQTNDSFLVVSHDDSLIRNFDNSSKISEISLEKLKRLPYNDSDEYILTFEEFCDFFSKNSSLHSKVAIHLKDPDNYNLGKSIIDILLKYTLLEKVFIFDVTIEVAKKLKEYNPSIQLGASIADRKVAKQLYSFDMVKDLGLFEIFWLDEWVDLYTFELVSNAKKSYAISPELHTLDGHPNSSDYKKTWENLVDWGVEGICTDHPVELRAFLKKKGSPL